MAYFVHSSNPNIDEKEPFMIFQVIFSLLLSVAIFILAFNLEVGGMGIGSNLNALMIVLGGTFSATLIAYPWKKLAWTAQLIKKAFFPRDETEWTISTLVKLARTYRQDGIRILEQQGNELSPGLLKTGVEMIAYQYSRDKIETVLQKEVQLIYGQYESAYKVLYNMARLAPALGLAGTIVNLIRVFGHIQDPQNLIGYMAVALLSTFYGVILANLCFIPLSNKLREFMDHEEIHFHLVQEGILDLYDEENSKAIEYKLEALSNAVKKANPNWPRSRLVLMPLKKRERASSVTL